MEYEQIRQRDMKFTEWRKEWAKKMPEVAARVFALRGTGYMGSGFHWNLEKRLGKVIGMLNDYDDPRYYHTPEAVMSQAGLKVGVERLMKDIEKAEKTARKP